jgi:CHAT domain-containing protein
MSGGGVGLDFRRVMRRASTRLTGLAAALLLALFAQPGQASAQTLAERLCGQRPSSAGAPTNETLLGTARSAEARLNNYRGATLANASLIPLDPAATEGAPAAPAAVGAYCAAAGETMRIAADGSQAQAIAYLLTGYRRAREGNDDRLAALSAYRLALVGIGDPAAAGARGARSVALAAAEAAPPPVPEDGSDICSFLDEVELAETSAREISEQALGCAAALARRSGDSRLAALSGLRLSLFYASVADEPGRDADGVRLFAREQALAALGSAQAVAAPSEQAELTARLVEAAIALGAAGELDAPIASLGRMEGGAGLAAGLEARRALAQGDLAAARGQLEAAILAESRRPLPARLPGYYLLLARADPDRSAAHVEAAYVALDNLRPLLPRLDPLTEESIFALRMRDVFAAAVEAQLAGADGAGEVVRIRRAQQIVEAYRQAELQSAFGNECLPPRDALRIEQLRPGEIVLYPLLLSDRIELLYVAGGASGEPRFRRLAPNRAVNRADVAKLVEELVLAMGSGANERWRPAARRLYDLLIAPVADQLGAESMLAIVPDGALRALPFAALLAPDGRYLVQQTRLSLIPALAYSQPDGAARPNGRLNVVAASLQQQMDLPAGYFPALTGTGREAQIAVEYASAGRNIPEFTRADLVDALDGARVDVLHLATHAAFNGRSDRSFIVANGEVIRLAELRTMIERSRQRGESLDLIILSACETAVGDDDVSMGLAGAVVQAGARSVIGSLWQVNDLGTAELMTRFYQLYSNGRSRSEALREAQLSLVDGGGDAANPYVWAAFALLGAWR